MSVERRNEESAVISDAVAESLPETTAEERPIALSRPLHSETASPEAAVTSTSPVMRLPMTTGSAVARSRPAATAPMAMRAVPRMEHAAVADESTIASALDGPVLDAPAVSDPVMDVPFETAPAMGVPVLGDGALPAGEHLSHLPTGARRHSDQGFATVEVFYATDRQRGALPLSAYQMSGHKQSFMAMAVSSLLLFAFAAWSCLRGRARTVTASVAMASLCGFMACAIVALGRANVEKHGVTYSAQRGVLTRGLCEVTVPDSHRRGRVERPSLLRFEFREDRRDHIVLTSAIELSASDFQTRLTTRVQEAPGRDLLVFVHGYNVGFESAVRRTAQIAVDLPFEGVPVCYSWPSQGTLLGYSIDETNSQWTITHLKQFLLELVQDSCATSINVVAHSMGNRAMTAAMRQISWEIDGTGEAPFDRIVLAAPDIDADRFRRDLAPPLLSVANQVTLYASSDDQALLASKKVHGYPRAGESGANIVVVPGIETVDVSGIDLSLLGHSYYGDNESMLRDLYDVIRARLPAQQRGMLVTRNVGPLVYWELAQRPTAPEQPSFR